MQRFLIILFLSSYLVSTVRSQEVKQQDYAINNGHAQSKTTNAEKEKLSSAKPKVGHPLPDFTFNDVNYFKSPSVSSEDLKGKWLILDFFTQNCLACFASFPKINSLQNEFSDKVQFILVGDNEHRYGKNVKSIFEKVRKKQNLQLTVAYDSSLFTKWEISAVPYIVIIDDKGIVRAINNSQDLNSKTLKSLIDSNDVSSFRIIEYDRWDLNKPFLVDGNGGPDSAFSFRSILSKWSRPTPFYGPSSIEIYNKTIGGRKGFQGSGMPVTELYRIAYLGGTNPIFGEPGYGKVARLPIIEGIDSSEFVSNSKTGKNMYNYSLSVPDEKATTEHITEIMQSDLKNYFGFKATVKLKKMPYWKLTATKEARKKLKTAGKTHYTFTGASGVDFGNYPISILLTRIWAFHQFQPPFIDETKINYNIDINLDVLMTDFNKVKTALAEQGLILKKSKKQMKVLILSKE